MTTDLHCSPELFSMIKRMRAPLKRRFFTSRPGSLQRSEALQESKKYEKEIDEFIRRKEQPEQNNLFGSAF